MARTLRHHDASRERIVDVAEALFVARGSRRVQLADIAEAAGLTTPALYRYFRDRRALEVAVLRRQVAEELADTAAAAATGTEGADRLRAWFDRQAAYLEGTDPGAVRILLGAILEGATDDELRAAATPAVEGTNEFFARAVAARADRDAILALLAALGAGVSFLHASGQLGVSPRVVYEKALELLGEGHAGAAIRP